MTRRVSREGERVPDVELAELTDGNVKKYGSRELFGGRKVILFALPGAFTPTCSTAHVPGYVAHLKSFRDAGIDDVVCLSVNDPFGEFTRAMGMSIDHRDAGLGTRSWRYSMLVNDTVIEKMFIEPDVPGDPFEVSDADTMLNHLRPGRKEIGPVLMLARHGCPYCAKAKQVLSDRGVAFDAVYLGDELTMQGVKAASGAAKVPQVFIDGKLIGGSDQLEKFFSAGS